MSWNWRQISSTRLCSRFNCVWQGSCKVCAGATFRYLSYKNMRLNYFSWILHIYLSGCNLFTCDGQFPVREKAGSSWTFWNSVYNSWHLKMFMHSSFSRAHLNGHPGLNRVTCGGDIALAFVYKPSFDNCDETSVKTKVLTSEQFDKVGFSRWDLNLKLILDSRKGLVIIYEEKIAMFSQKISIEFSGWS